MDTIATIVHMLSDTQVNVSEVRKLIDSLPEKKIHYTFPDDVVNRFKELMAM